MSCPPAYDDDLPSSFGDSLTGLEDTVRLQRLMTAQGFLLDMTLELTNQTDLADLLESAGEAALRIFDAERATVWVHDRAAGELFTLVGTGLRQPLRIPDSAGVAGEVLQKGGLINIVDARRDPRVIQMRDFPVRTMLCYPLMSFDQTRVGVVQLLNKRGGQFDRDDERLIRVLGAHVGVALQRATLLREYAEKQKMAEALRVAREIQQSLLPGADPQVDRYELHGWNRPADETGGDAFDFIELPDGRLGLVVCDATGHGVGPALLVANCLAYLRAIALNQTGVCPAPNKVLEQANRLLADDVPDDRFITAFFGVLDPGTNRLEWSSAGHGPMLFIPGGGGAYREFRATGVPLGILDDVAFEAGEAVDLVPGDLFAIVTDGFLEWADPSGEQFETPRAVEVLRGGEVQPLRVTLETLVERVEAFGKGVVQKDDLTAVLVMRRE